MKNKSLWRGICAIFIVIFCLGLCMTTIAFEYSGSINAVLGIESGSVEGSGGMVYESDYGPLSDENLAKLVEDEIAFCKREMEEGAVLLKNNGTLPLASNIKNISLFGRASADIIYKSHAGGGIVSEDTAITLKEALEDANFTINPTLYNAYDNSSTKRVASSNASAWDIGEEDADFYTDAIKSSFNSYKDAAIVVLSRDGGEGYDLSTNDIDGLPALALHDSEKDMLKLVKDSGFTNIIVLINSGNAMEVGWLEDEEYGVDACLFIGQPGRYGLAGVPSLLKGEANPSGHLADTYAENSLSSPVMQNYGVFEFNNYDAATMGTKNYVVFQESIYKGYKYYETRYEDLILGRGNADSTKGSTDGEAWNYADEMSYTFGYGLSYTTFSQTFDSLTYDSATDSYIAKVTVKNTGNKAGKSVAQIYLQSPYGEYEKTNKVEKSAVQIIGFGKTQELAPNATEQLTITIDRYLTASYDGFNAKTYILSQGDHLFSLGDDAHDAVNNLLAYKGATGMYDAEGNPVAGNASKVKSVNVATLDKTTYATSKETGAAVTNKFVGQYAVDVNEFYDDDPVTYLTRDDWDGTFPAPVDLACSDSMAAAMVSKYYEKSSSTAGLTEEQINGVELETPIMFYEMHGLDYNDPKWETFLSQLSLDDMSQIISDSLGQGAIATVGKPANKNADGPDGYGMNYRYGTQDSPTCYNVQSLSVCSWSYEIMRLRGYFYGEDCIYARGQMAWGPGLDLHRSPYSGRNFEYSSEDGIFTGLMAAVQVAAMAEKGVIASPKHFWANDQETNRGTACTFMTEQTAREMGLRAFELPFKAGCGGSMMAMSRIGCKVSFASKATLTDICRNEWGFNGIFVTDSSGAENVTRPTVECMLAGTDMFCLARRTSTIYSAIYDNDDSYMYDVLLETNHRFYYQYANSTLVNGLSADTVVSDTIGWWQIVSVLLLVIVGVVAVGSGVLFVVFGYVKKEA